MDEYFERITAKDGAKKTFHNYKSAYFERQKSLF